MKIEISLNWLLIPVIALTSLLLSNYFMSGNWSWYFSLALPPITPPGWFISRAWQLIYLLTTLCTLLVFNLFERDWKFWIIIGLLSVNIGLNIYWTLLFFKQHLIGPAVVCAAALTGTIWAAMWLIAQSSWLISLLLLPYVLWSAFATFLNFWIWLIN